MASGAKRYNPHTRNRPSQHYTHCTPLGAPIHTKVIVTYIGYRPYTSFVGTIQIPYTTYVHATHILYIVQYIPYILIPIFAYRTVIS